jgi:hypothetical protein
MGSSPVMMYEAVTEFAREKKMSGRLAGKVALVMGAGSVGDIPAGDDSIAGWGNGKAVAVLYAREGARIGSTKHILAPALPKRNT